VSGKRNDRHDPVEGVHVSATQRLKPYVHLHEAWVAAQEAAEAKSAAEAAAEVAAQVDAEAAKVVNEPESSVPFG
jgi:hypothetical protein